MEKTDIRFAWIAIGLSILIGCFAFWHWSFVKKVSPSQRRAAFSRAYILGIYTDIEFLEKDKGKTIAKLVGDRSDSGNINFTLVQLLESDGMASTYTMPVSNYDGTRVFVDAWGAPYNIRLITNTDDLSSQAPIQNRVSISSTNISE